MTSHKNKALNDEEYIKYHTDHELFDALMLKDRLAERQLFYQKINLLYFLAKKWVHNEEDAEFLARLAFTKTLTSQKPFTDLKHVINFMRKAVKFACLDFLKSLKAGKTMPQYNVPLELVEEELANKLYNKDDFDEDESLAKFYAEIEKLDQRDREIMQLTIDGKKTAEIAAAMDLEERFVRERRSRIREIIKNNVQNNNLITVLLFIATPITCSICI